MIERSSLVTHAVVGERFHEIDHVCLILSAEVERTNIRAVVRTNREIATTVVEFHHLPERGQTAVMEVRPRELDVAQSRRLEATSSGSRRIVRWQASGERF